MKLWDVHPATIRHGDQLCDSKGAPFATVNGNPWLDGTSIRVATDVVDVEFPPGMLVNIIR